MSPFGEYGGEKAGGGTFAVGAGDVDESKLKLRIARERRQPERVFEPELCPKPTEPVQEFNRGTVRRS